MDRLVVCNNAFDHPEASNGQTTRVGEVLRLGAGEADRLQGARLVRPLGAEIATRGPGGTLRYHKGGGWYLVTDQGGTLLKGKNPVQGQDKAIEKARAHASRKASSTDDGS